MFNKKYKEIVELQKRKIEELENANKKLVNEIKELSEEKNNNPDCVKGAWCRNCAYYSSHCIDDGYSLRLGYFGHCNKGRCSSFIPFKGTI